MKKGLLITAVLALVFGMALVSCTQDAADSNALVQVSLSASKGDSKRLTSTDDSASVVTKYVLTATSKATTAANPYAPLDTHEANSLVWSQTYNSGSDVFASIEAGTAITLGYFSQGTWEFELEAYHNDNKIFYGKTSEDVYIKTTSGVQNINLSINHIEDGKGTIALGGFQAARTEASGGKLTIVSSEATPVINLEADATAVEGEAGMVTFTGLAKASGATYGPTEIPAGAYTITVAYGTKSQRFGITIVDGATVTIGTSEQILDSESYQNSGVTISGVAYVKNASLPVPTYNEGKTTATFTFTADTPYKEGKSATITWTVNGEAVAESTVTTTPSNNETSKVTTYTSIFEFTPGTGVYKNCNVVCEISYTDGYTVKDSCSQTVQVINGLFK